MIQAMRSLIKTASFILALLCIGINVSAQVVAAAGIGVTLSLTPPYSPRLSDYAEQPGKVIIIIKNNSTSPRKVYLKLNITGDNGIVIASAANNRPAQPITLQGSQLIQADGNMLRDLFDENKLTYTHITAADIIHKNGLPEGNYQVCVRAFDFIDNVPLSDPVTGCRQIHLASLEPPVLIKPFDKDAVKYFQPQSLLFSWSIPTGSEPGTKYHFRMVEMIDTKKNSDDAYRNSMPFYEADLASNVLLYGPSQPTMVKGRKYAWAVTALAGTRGAAYRNKGLSAVRSFTFGELAPAADMVKLVYPANNAVISPDPDFTKNFTTWDYDPLLNGSQEKAFIVVMNGNQTPEQALQQNTNIANDKEANKKSFVDFTKYAGKTLAWQVNVLINNKTYSSKIQTFTILPFTNITIKEMGSFVLCGFPITVTNLHQISEFNFGGSGKTQLYKGGPSVDIKFDKLTILPFDATVETQDDGSGKMDKKKNEPPVKIFKRWTATAGTAQMVKMTSEKFKFKMSIDAEGSVWFNARDINYEPSIPSKWDETRGYFVTSGTNSSRANYTGKFTWQTGFFAKNKLDVSELITYRSASDLTFRFDYQKKFNSIGALSELSFSGLEGTNVITPVFGKNTSVTLTPVLNFDGDSTVSFSFSGRYVIFHTQKILQVDFEKQPTLSFDVAIPKGWQHMLNDDGSVMAYFDNVHVDLSSSASTMNKYGLSIPDISMILSNKGKQFTLHYKNAYFSGDYGLAFASEKTESQQLSIMGFPFNSNKSVIEVTNSSLVKFKIDGDLVIPVIKQKAAVSFLANSKGIQAAEINFVAGQTTSLYKNAKSGDECTYKANYGIITDGKITVGGSFSFRNLTAGKNLNIADVQSADIAIFSNGDVSMPSLSGYDNTLSHPQGNLNGYAFTANVLTLRNEKPGFYFIAIGGVMVLADNLSISSPTGNNFSTRVVFSEADITNDGLAFADIKHGPSAGQNNDKKDLPESGEISFATEASAGTDNESSRFSGASLKYFDKDVKYGTGFRADIKYALKSPADPSTSTTSSINAVLWIGHMKEGYNYWFLEAGQKNVVIIPTGVLDLSINGFTGRVFYHMRHDGDNINDNKSYVPDNSKFMGIYGQVNLITAADNGTKFWGNLSLEMSTTNSGPEYIKLLGNGDFITGGEGSAGILQAKDCKLEIYASPFARITGNFTGILNAQNIVTVKANAGFDFSKQVFHIWGSGSGSFMGKEAPASCSFDLDQNHVKIGGTFKIIDLSWHNDGIFCDDDASVDGTISLGAQVDYSPFHFKGDASFNVNASLKECGETIISIPFSLGGQVEFPSPSCISMGVSIGPFDLVLGFKDGGFIFDNCF
jgi:TANFOR domain-containing protein